MTTPLARLWVWTTVGVEDSYCFPDCHVFEEPRGYTGGDLPGNTRCACGQSTWDEAVQDAWKRIVAKNQLQEEAGGTSLNEQFRIARAQ